MNVFGLNIIIYFQKNGLGKAKMRQKPYPTNMNVFVDIWSISPQHYKCRLDEYL